VRGIFGGVKHATCLVRSSVALRTTAFRRMAARFRLAKSEAPMDVSED
jgi:hypothetical protein